MLNYIWGGLMLIAIVASAFTGKLEATSMAAISGAKEAVTMAISLLGVMCLWTGIMKIASESGITNGFAKLLRPLTKILFPKLKKDSAALEAIVMNMIANLMGMSNAATPFGLKAMRELSRINKGNAASNEMCMFIVINTASLQLIPTTLLAIRQNAGSANPFEIIVPVWIASICAVCVGVIAVKIFERVDKLC